MVKPEAETYLWVQGHTPPQASPRYSRSFPPPTGKSEVNTELDILAQQGLSSLGHAD